MIDPYDTAKATEISGSIMPYSLALVLPIQRNFNLGITPQIIPVQHIPEHLRLRDSLQSQLQQMSSHLQNEPRQALAESSIEARHKLEREFGVGTKLNLIA